MYEAIAKLYRANKQANRLAYLEIASYFAMKIKKKDNPKSKIRNSK
jgi:hypothetical protein